jgi:hypothetical protein
MYSRVILVKNEVLERFTWIDMALMQRLSM